MRVAVRSLAAAACAGLWLLASMPPASLAAAPSPAPEHAALLHASDDGVVARALIPSPTNAHGELRVARRQGATCVQTVLCSPLLVRGLQGIRRKERTAWPPGQPGHEDSERYLAALDQGQAAALDAFARRADGADARRKLLIELVDAGGTPATAFVAVYTIEVATDRGRIDITRATPVAVVDASPDYVRRAMRLQAGEAFRLQGTALEKLLAP